VVLHLAHSRTGRSPHTSVLYAFATAKSAPVGSFSKILKEKVGREAKPPVTVGRLFSFRRVRNEAVKVHLYLEQRVCQLFDAVRIVALRLHFKWLRQQNRGKLEEISAEGNTHREIRSV